MTLTREELIEAIEGSDARLVIIDPLQAFLPNGTNWGMWHRCGMRRDFPKIPVQSIFRSLRKM